jgi:hypothetical protein
MPAEVLYKGPTPPDGQKWCMVCAFTWKGVVNERYADEIKRAAEAPDGSETVWIDAVADADMPLLAVTVATGLYAPTPQFGPIDLCWSHLAPVKLMSAGGLHLPVPGMNHIPPGGGQSGSGRWTG